MGHAPSSASAPAPRDRVELRGPNSRARPVYSQGSVAQGSSTPFVCAKCGINHSGIRLEVSTGYFKCGQTVHFMKECPKTKQGGGSGGNRYHSSLVTPPDKAAFRGATSGAGGGTDRLYAFNNLKNNNICQMLSLI